MKLIKNHLPINLFSNPGTPLRGVMALAVHNTGNPGTDNNHTFRYFRNLQLQNPNDDRLDRYAGTHYGTDPTGSMQYIREEYRTYNCGAYKYTEFKKQLFGSKYPNDWVISVEMHHPDSTGKPEIKTYNHLIDLSVNICDRYKLDPMTQIIRHYDVTGKICPKWYVDHPELFEEFKKSVKLSLDKWRGREKLDMR